MLGSCHRRVFGMLVIGAAYIGCIPKEEPNPAGMPPPLPFLFVGQSRDTLETSIYRGTLGSDEVDDVLATQDLVVDNLGRHVLFTPDAPYPIPSPDGSTFAYIAQTLDTNGVVYRSAVVRDTETGALALGGVSDSIAGLFKLSWTNDGLILHAKQPQTNQKALYWWVPGGKTLLLQPIEGRDLKFLDTLPNTGEILVSATDTPGVVPALGLLPTVIAISLREVRERVLFELAPDQTPFTAQTSGDGERIVMSALDGIGQTQILVWEANILSDITTPLGMNAHSPKWRPHREELVYATDENPNEDNDTRFYLADSQGRNRLHLTASFDFSRSLENARWAPHGESLMVDYRYTDFGLGIDRNDIWLVDADSTTAYPVTPDPIIGGSKRLGQWSPDGDWVIFERQDSAGTRHVAAVQSDASSWWQLEVPDPLAIHHPILIHDQTLVYPPN